MAIILKNNEIFLHIPKTGGSWVSKVLKMQSLTKAYIGCHKHFDWARIESLIIPKSKLLRYIFFEIFKIKEFHPSFCFVRHPLTWYESWWKYNNQSYVNWKSFTKPHVWHPCHVLNSCKSTDFNHFVSNVLKKRPGFVSELYSSYAHSEINFVGKQENLAEDLCYFLKTRNYDFSEEYIKEESKVNISSNKLVKWDQSLKLEVMDTEKIAMLRYSYE